MCERGGGYRGRSVCEGGGVTEAGKHERERGTLIMLQFHLRPVDMDKKGTQGKNEYQKRKGDVET